MPAQKNRIRYRNTGLRTAPSHASTEKQDQVVEVSVQHLMPCQHRKIGSGTKGLRTTLNAMPTKKITGSGNKGLRTAPSHANTEKQDQVLKISVPVQHPMPCQHRKKNQVLRVSVPLQHPMPCQHRKTGSGTKGLLTAPSHASTEN
jgi:hypothetical protein